MAPIFFCLILLNAGTGKQIKKKILNWMLLPSLVLGPFFPTLTIVFLGSLIMLIFSLADGTLVWKGLCALLFSSTFILSYAVNLIMPVILTCIYTMALPSRHLALPK